jgi:nitroreductase
MELFEAIAKRHSYRGPFSKQPIPREDLLKIVQAGLQAPSGVNAQSTSFVIVDDPALIGQTAAIVPKTSVKDAQALIICIGDPTPVYHGHSFATEDCAAAVENLLLAVTALGYATVWLDGFLRLKDRTRRLAELFQIPAPKEIRVLLPLGAPLESWPQKEKLPLEKRAWFNAYGHSAD